MGRKNLRYTKEAFFILFFAGLCFLFVSCSSKESGVKTVVTNEIPQASQSSENTPVTPPLDTKELCVFVTPKDSSGAALHVEDILRVAVVSKAGDELPAQTVGISLVKICPTELRDYLMDILLTESKNKRMFHATFPVSKDELQKKISKDIVAHEETESLIIQGPATLTTNATASYFASPASNGEVNSDLYTGVSAYFFYVSPKSAVTASQTSYDGLNITTGNTGNLRLTLWCEAWSDTKGLLGYGVRTVLINDATSPTGSATVTVSRFSRDDFMRVK